MDDPSHGIEATIIDLGLARMNDDGDEGEGGKVHWTPFDEEIFEGEGDYQFDVYRMMRDVGVEEGYRPVTNVMVSLCPLLGFWVLGLEGWLTGKRVVPYCSGYTTSRLSCYTRND